MPFALTDYGPAPQTLGEIVAEAAARVAELAGADFDASDLTSVEGQLFHVLAERELWNQGGMVDVANSLSIHKAQGRQLEAIGNTLGLPRLGASYGAVAGTIFGTPGTDAGNRKFQHLASGTVWRSPSPAVIGAGGFVTVTLEAVDPVSVSIPPTVSTGWLVMQVDPSITAISNATEGTPGEPEEDLEVYRARLVASTASGSGTEPSIVAALLKVPGVTGETRVLVNRTLAVDANGVPPKSVEAIVVGGGDEGIVRALYGSASAIAGFAGTTSIPANTYPGVPVEVRFTRPSSVALEVEVALIEGDAEAALPVDYVAQVQGAVAGIAWKIGQNPTAARLYKAIGDALPEDSYDGISAQYRPAGSADPWLNNYPIGPRARATIAAADVGVSVVP